MPAHGFPRYVPNELAADLAHGLAGPDEIGLADLVTLFCLPDPGRDEVADLGVRGAAAKQRFDVVLLDRKQAGPQVAFGGEPYPVADLAEGIADGRDDADPALAAIAKLESRGGRRPLIGDRLERKLAVDGFDDVAARDHGIHRPDAVGVEGHELDEADFIPFATRQLGEVEDLVIVAPAHHHHVELGGIDPRGGRRHAVDAAEIAAVRDRDSQVIGDTPEGVAEMEDRLGAGHEISICGVQLGVMPPFTPMEAKVQSELPRGEAWQYEPKWDGFRAVAFKDGDEVIIHSRNQKPLTRYFPELVPAIQKIKPKRAVLDGEIVIFTGYGTDFDAMTLRIHPAASRVNMLAAEQPATYIAFDLLADGDESLLDKPLRERRQRLEKLLGSKPASI